MNDQNLQHLESLDSISRDRPRWLNVLAFAATLVAISGSGCPFFPEGAGGLGKAAVNVATGTSLWTTNGPYGGQIRSIAIDPVSSAAVSAGGSGGVSIEPAVGVTVYAGGIGGVFKSTNGGVNWTPASNGITRYDQHIIVNTVVISPASSQTLFAGENTGLYKSVDAGASWSTAGNAPIGARVVALAIDPLDANKIYSSTNDRIYRSVDGGNTWQAAFSGLKGTTPYSIAVVPGALFTGTSNGLFKSTDGGVTWSASDAGFPVIGGGNSNPILTLTVLADPSTPTTLYATPRGLLYKSTDSGASWRPVVGAPGGFYFAIDAKTPTTMYQGGGEGVSKSTDGGVSWTAINTGLSSPGYSRVSVGALTVDPRAGSTIFVGSQAGVFRSTNAGTSWAESSTGLANVTVHVVAVDPLTPTTIYAGTRDQGVFKSTDGGLSWKDSSNGLFEAFGGWVVSLAIDPLTPSTIYAGTNNFVFKSIDSGATWKPARTGASTYLTPAIAINPLNPKVIVAGTLGVGINGGIYLSTDAAATWTPIRTGLPNSSTIYGLSFSTKFPNTLLAAVRSPAGDAYMTSSDSGATWAAIYPGYDPTQGTVSVIDFLHKTMGIQSVALGYDAAFLPPYRPPYPAVTGINPRGECSLVSAVVFDANTPDQGYVGADCGVGKGTTANIAAINAGLPVAGVKALALTPSGNRLYAGLDGGSVYQYKADQKLTVITEFYNPSLDYYFMTSRASDAALLDSFAAWRRTGKVFSTYISQEPGTLGISRYYFDQIAVNKSRGSHFYTLTQSEKDALLVLNPGNNRTPGLPFNEGIDSYAFMPLIEGVGGSCAAGLLPVYRMFRGQMRFPDNPNHRFTTELSIYNSFVALGWDGEGVKFCVPN